MISNVRVRRPEEFKDILNLLSSENENQPQVFDTLKSALVFSAALGFKIKKRVPFENSSERIALHTFKEDTDIPFIYSLAVAEYDDISYLRAEKFEESLLIFEEYANGGLRYLSTYLAEDINIKSSVEGLMHDLTSNKEKDMVSDIFEDWN